MSNEVVVINKERLYANLRACNEFGYNAETKGIDRLGYSTPDFEARKWLARTMKEAGMAVRWDAVGNVIGRFGPSTGPCIMSGSHIDSVPSGGKLDGCLGVLAALECVMAIQDAGIVPSLAVEVVATAEEEGRFGGMLGSQAMAGASFTPNLH